jgi:hypothetical protein
MDDKTSDQAVLSSIWHTSNRTCSIYPGSKPIRTNDKTSAGRNLSPIRAAIAARINLEASGWLCWWLGQRGSG